MLGQEYVQSLRDIGHTNTYNLKHDLLDHEFKLHDFKNLLNRLSGGVEECVNNIQRVYGIVQSPETEALGRREKNPDDNQNEDISPETFEQDVESCAALVRSCYKELRDVENHVAKASTGLCWALRVLEEVGQILHPERIVKGNSKGRSKETMDQLAVPQQAHSHGCGPGTDEEIAIALSEQWNYPAEQSYFNRRKDTAISEIMEAELAIFNAALYPSEKAGLQDTAIREVMGAELAMIKAGIHPLTARELVSLDGAVEGNTVWNGHDEHWWDHTTQNHMGSETPVKQRCGDAFSTPTQHSPASEELLIDLTILPVSVCSGERQSGNRFATTANLNKRVTQETDHAGELWELLFPTVPPSTPPNGASQGRALSQGLTTTTPCATSAPLPAWDIALLDNLTTDLDTPMDQLTHYDTTLCASFPAMQPAGSLVGDNRRASIKTDRGVKKARLLPRLAEPSSLQAYDAETVSQIEGMPLAEVPNEGDYNVHGDSSGLVPSGVEAETAE